MDVSSDIAVTPGKTYLLVVSKNRYEQIVAQNKKQAEVGFNALLFLAYEITANGALLPGPRPTLFGESPKDVKTAENDLAKLSKGKSKNGGT
ncbi:hypothetical protein LG3211_3976 [Lysobacter gummosus]|nr:hypothetical protein LG3211_3976 [Lysobacter gummosus]